MKYGGLLGRIGEISDLMKETGCTWEQAEKKLEEEITLTDFIGADPLLIDMATGVLSPRHQTVPYIVDQFGIEEAEATALLDHWRVTLYRSAFLPPSLEIH